VESRKHESQHEEIQGGEGQEIVHPGKQTWPTFPLAERGFQEGLG
jgi:hypothetical protein